MHELLKFSIKELKKTMRAIRECVKCDGKPRRSLNRQKILTEERGREEEEEERGNRRIEEGKNE